MVTMLAPKIPLRLLSALTHVDFPQEADTLFARKSAVQLALVNCEIVRDICTDQMHVEEQDLRDDIHQMRVAALLAIPIAEASLRIETEGDFNQREREFRSHYAKLIQSVKYFLWDGGPVTRRFLWPLVDEVM